MLILILRLGFEAENDTQNGKRKSAGKNLLGFIVLCHLKLFFFSFFGICFVKDSEFNF